MRLFVSYAHVDKAIVNDWIVRKLRAGHHEVWIDESLSGGQEWKPQLIEAIRGSDALVYAMTPESIVSEVCQWELAKAVELGKQIIPVLMQPRTQIPEWLGNIQYVDFSEGPTGDAVAQLIGGLQRLSSTQIPPLPPNVGLVSTQVAPAGKVEKTKDMTNNEQKRRFSPELVVGIIGSIVIPIVLFVLSRPSNTQNSPLVVNQPTPPTPIVQALRDLEIRNGPGPAFSRINILPSGSSLDILGISDDRLWYLVLLSDGTTGWILASSSGAQLNGDRAVVRVVIPSVTPSFTPTATQPPTQVVIVSSNTLSPTDMPTFTSVPPTQTSVPTNTPIPPNVPLTEIPAPATTSAPTIQPVTTTATKSYPCEATIISGGSNANLLNVVHIRPAVNESIVSSVRVGQVIRIRKEQSDNTGSNWYQIEDSQTTYLGWIQNQFVQISNSCPN